MVSATLPQHATAIGGDRTYRVGANWVTVKVQSSATDETYALFEAWTPLGGGVASYCQTAEDEAFFVLEGTYRFELAGVCSDLGPGSYVFVPRGTAHAFVNAAGVPARMLVMATPGARRGYFFATPGEPELVEATLHNVGQGWQR